MSVVAGADVARVIRAHKNVLVLAGTLCGQMELDGKKLSDYAADISQRAGAPLAATGDAIEHLRARGAQTSKKLAIQIVEMLRYEGWRDPIMSARPDLLVLIGYPREIARALVCAAPGVETIVLGTSPVSEAGMSFGEISQQQLGRELDTILVGLG